MKGRRESMQRCEDSSDGGDGDDHYDDESPRRRSGPAARCAPRFAAVLASPGFAERSGPFQSHPLQTALRPRPLQLQRPQKTHARVPHARTGPPPAPYSDRHRRFLVPRGRSLRSLSQDGAHACRAHGIPRRPIRAVGEPRGASPAQPHPRASSAEGGAGSGGSLRYAGPPPHPVLQSSSRRAPRSSPRGRGSDRPEPLAARVPLRRSRSCAPP